MDMERIHLNPHDLLTDQELNLKLSSHNLNSIKMAATTYT